MLLLGAAEIDATGIGAQINATGIGASPFEALLGAVADPTPSLIHQPVFDTDDESVTEALEEASVTEALEAAVTLAAKRAEEADEAELAIASSSSSSSSMALPAITHDDVVKATQTFVAVLPRPAHVSRTSERGEGAARGRSTSLKRQNSTITRRDRSSSNKKQKIDSKQAQEYTANALELKRFGLTMAQQHALEEGLTDEGIIAKQREILTGLNLRKNAAIAPRPAASRR